MSLHRTRTQEFAAKTIWLAMLRMGLAPIACRHGLIPTLAHERSSASTNPVVSFVVAHWNAPEFAASCTKSIRQCAASISHELLIIDDNSSENAFSELQRQASYDRMTRFYSGGGHSRSLEWGFHHSRGTFVVLLDQDAMLLSPRWVDLLDEFSHNPELILLGCADKVPGLRNSPQMHHASFLIIHRQRCLERLKPPYLYGERPNYRGAQVSQEEPYHLISCKALEYNANSCGYLNSYLTKYGFGTASFHNNPLVPLVYHQWYSRFEDLEDNNTTPSGLNVGKLKRAIELVKADYANGCLDFSPVNEIPNMK